MENASVDGILYPRKFAGALGSLVYLRYLSVRNVDLSLIPSIQNMVLLQTLKLDLFNRISIPSWLSRNILGKLGHLRHLYLPRCHYTTLPKKEKLTFDGLGKLETLENFSNLWCEPKDLPKLINLQKLTLEVDSDDVKETMKNLSALALSSSSDIRYLGLSLNLYKRPVENVRELFWDYYSILQNLSITGQVEELAQLFVNQTRNIMNNHVEESSIHITSLKLLITCLVDDPMPVLEKFPTLRNLNLSVNSYVGKEMVCSSMGFPKLTSLVLNGLNLVKWTIEKGSMPVLTDLEITNCWKLEALPEGMIFLTSLHHLELNCNSTDFIHKLRTEDGKQGPDFYRVAHIPHVAIFHETDWQYVE